MNRQDFSRDTKQKSFCIGRGVLAPSTNRSCFRTAEREGEGEIAQLIIYKSSEKMKNNGHRRRTTRRTARSGIKTHRRPRPRTGICQCSQCAHFYAPKMTAEVGKTDRGLVHHKSRILRNEDMLPSLNQSLCG
jgi:hypothetical protein